MICAGCGEWIEVPKVEGATLACPECGHREPFTRLPLFALTGPSGTGKSTVCRLLTARLRDRMVVLEQDLLWLDGLRDPAGDHAAFRRTWLRLIASINQGGRPVLLCGTVAPPELEHRPERALLGKIHYLALTCDPEVLSARLRTRPAWRGWNEARIAEAVEFDAWLRDYAARARHPVELLDTTTSTPADTADAVTRWLHPHL